jgi:DNA-binding transcriptional LysR family regulator
VKLEELAESPLVFRTGSSTLNELAKFGVRLNLAVQCEAADAVKASVYKGMGVGILHWESVENDLAAGMLTNPCARTREAAGLLLYQLR